MAHAVGMGATPTAGSAFTFKIIPEFRRRRRQQRKRN